MVILTIVMMMIIAIMVTWGHGDLGALVTRY